MQIFISDLHLTDGSSGQTINSGAFEVFRDNLKILVESVLKQKGKMRELKIVLLGDIFDIIRSTRWLAGNVRPWSPLGPDQKTMVAEIVKAILGNEENRKSLACFQELREFARRKGLDFQLQYVIGNHDWLINRYADCRQQVADALGMSPGAAAPPFPTKTLDGPYRTFARHGDVYDKLNYLGTRDGSSLGDAFVIDLLNKYPGEAERALNSLPPGQITTEEKEEVVNDLKELDNVRPALDAPAWVCMISNRAKRDSVRHAIEETWHDCVRAFLDIPFLRKMDTWFWPDTVDFLQGVLQLSCYTSTRTLERLAEFAARFSISSAYHKNAFAEAEVRNAEADYIVYGHTHGHTIIPLDQVRSSKVSRDVIYFNTGTWRQTWNKATFEKTDREFIGWKVLTYIAFYQEDENKGYRFEVWNGALG
jgi:UDP-2,3-diacylglucosamine pyrophosphatase LpxH